MTDIIFQDESIIIVNKEAGLAIQQTKSGDISLIEKLNKQFQKNIFLTQRLDQVASGICIFAKNKRSCDSINQDLAANLVEKKYLAVVNSGLAKDEDSFHGLILHNTSSHKSYVNPTGKPASLSYKKISSSDRYDCLEVEIEGGRFHQVRCMLAYKGMPIKGDVKYGAKRKNKDRSIHLHAYSISFNHPKTKEIVQFSAPLPSENLWQFFASEMDKNGS